MSNIAASGRPVDPFQFLDGITKRVVKTWVSIGKPTDIPWTPLNKPLKDCRIAFVSSGGIVLKTDPPFDQDIERNDPWWSDPSYRIIPRDTVAEDIKVYHLHYNPEFAERDLNCVLPLQRLAELEAGGEIGSVAPSHYSYMGYTLRPQKLLEESVPAIIRQLHEEQVDVALLVPV